MLKTRILTAAVLVPLTLAALFLLPPRAWGVVTLAVVGIGASEWANLAGCVKGWQRAFALATIASGALLLFAPVAGFSADTGWPAGVTLTVCGAAALFWLVVAPTWLAAGWRVDSKLVLLMTGWLVLLAAWVALVQLQAHSPALLLAAMAIVWIADTAAYFTGRTVGRRKLAPAISPGKTWEGVYGALAATTVYTLLLLWLAPDVAHAGELSPRAVAGWVGLVLALTALSVVGDLFKSLLKRQRGIKDSGSILPGHGGVIDRIDALLAVMPPSALLAQHALR